MFGRYCARNTIAVNFYNSIKSQAKKRLQPRKYKVFSMLVPIDWWNYLLIEAIDFSILQRVSNINCFFKLMISDKNEVSHVDKRRFREFIR
jgi:hypothetical protein